VAHRGRSNADEVLAAAIAAGQSHRAAAATAGVSERTTHRRLKDPAFRARVIELRVAMTAKALGRLTDGMSAASDALNKLVSHRDPNVRHKAATKVIELALKVREQAELEERLARVEQMLAGGADDGGDPGQDRECGGTRPDAGGPPGSAA
jgi:hypothetical protein